MMSGLIETITALLGPSGPILVLGAIGLLLVTLTLPFMLVKKKNPFDRIQSPTQMQVDTKFAKNSNAPSLRYAKKNGPNLDKFASFLEPQDIEEFSKKKLNLLRAGYRSKDAVRNFHFIQFSLAILGAIIGIAIVVFFLADAELSDQLLKGGAPAGIGYYLPMYWVNSRATKRQEELAGRFRENPFSGPH